ncbi:hypothetical protein MSG28_010312 [Choristoneura fumiferana]|uniref:Uncharacterized protein n=1 Tax=Choristoneura fumiferana TaxID=7141 RepID=A0ACC0KKQ9_CHOFU|nr:hypothetical protein MSG28_010312 [Choristoneura fumiferana]
MLLRALCCRTTYTRTFRRMLREGEGEGGAAKSAARGGPTGATESNIDEYMDKLNTLATETKNHAVIKQAKDILNRIELPMN